MDAAIGVTSLPGSRAWSNSAMFCMHSVCEHWLGRGILATRDAMRLAYHKVDIWWQPWLRLSRSVKSHMIRIGQLHFQMPSNCVTVGTVVVEINIQVGVWSILVPITGVCVPRCGTPEAINFDQIISIHITSNITKSFQLQFA